MTSRNTWVIHSGASCRITIFKEQLGSLDENSNEEVTIGDKFTHLEKGIGTYAIQ